MDFKILLSQFWCAKELVRDSSVTQRTGDRDKRCKTVWNLVFNVSRIAILAGQLSLVGNGGSRAPGRANGNAPRWQAWSPTCDPSRPSDEKIQRRGKNLSRGQAAVSPLGSLWIMEMWCPIKPSIGHVPSHRGDEGVVVESRSLYLSSDGSRFSASVSVFVMRRKGAPTCPGWGGGEERARGAPIASLSCLVVDIWRRLKTASRG